MPKNQHHPTPEELDDKVKLDLEPDRAIRLIMETGEADEGSTPEKADRGT